MSGQAWLAVAFLVLVAVWLAELVAITRWAPRVGRDPLLMVSGAAIFFVFALPIAKSAPDLVEQIGRFWDAATRPLRHGRAGSLHTTPRLVMPGRTVLLVHDRIRIGRYPNNDIVIDHPTVSAYHAELVRRPDGRYELVDRESRNGTRINGTPVRSAILKHGDQITLGAITVHYLATSMTEEALNRGGVPLRRR